MEDKIDLVFKYARALLEKHGMVHPTLTKLSEETEDKLRVAFSSKKPEFNTWFRLSVEILQELSREGITWVLPPHNNFLIQIGVMHRLANYLCHLYMGLPAEQFLYSDF